MAGREVPTVTLSKGAAMPLLGLGTWQSQGNDAYDSVRTALDLGYRHFDTATMYRNERQVGRAVRESGVPRDEVFVTTKLQPRTPTAPTRSSWQACARSSWTTSISG